MDVSVLANDEAMAVEKLLASFPQTVVLASEKCEPFYVTRHLVELAQAFNKYYYEYRIIDENIPQTNARIALAPVSYTHLDVYKRQAVHVAGSVAVAIRNAGRKEAASFKRDSILRERASFKAFFSGSESVRLSIFCCVWESSSKRAITSGNRSPVSTR